MDDYLPIFQMPGKAWFVLLAADNPWGCEHEGRFLPFTTPSNCMPLLPLLERPYSEVAELIQIKLGEAAKDVNLIETFPFDLLIHHALTWETPYWPLLAVQWLEAGCPLSDQSVTDLKRHSQSLRHRAQRLINQHTVPNA